MSKGFISDEMIEDIIKEWSGTKPNKKGGYYGLKNVLSNYGYEVEEPKSKLDEARSYYDGLFYKNGVIGKIKTLYEQAIEEIQEQKPKIDDDLIEWLKSWDYGCFAGNYSDDDDNENMNRLLQQLGIK